MKQEWSRIWWNQCLKQKLERCLSSAASSSRWVKLVWTYLCGLKSQRRGGFTQKESISQQKAKFTRWARRSVLCSAGTQSQPTSAAISKFRSVGQTRNTCWTSWLSNQARCGMLRSSADGKEGPEFITTEEGAPTFASAETWFLLVLNTNRYYHINHCLEKLSFWIFSAPDFVSGQKTGQTHSSYSFAGFVF